MAQTGRERTRDGGVYGSAVAAAGWQRSSAGRADLGPITDRMLDLAGIRPGHRVLSPPQSGSNLHRCRTSVSAQMGLTS
jgi:hypothetical protein